MKTNIEPVAKKPISKKETSERKASMTKVVPSKKPAAVVLEAPPSKMVAKSKKGVKANHVAVAEEPKQTVQEETKPERPKVAFTTKSGTVVSFVRLGRRKPLTKRAHKQLLGLFEKGHSKRYIGNVKKAMRDGKTFTEACDHAYELNPRGMAAYIRQMEQSEESKKKTEQGSDETVCDSPTEEGE